MRIPNGTRLARNLSAGIVAGIAAWSSYRHMTHVALSVGEQPAVAYVLPLSVDGLLVVASIAMVDDKAAGRAVRWSARVAFAAGIVASLGANIAAAHPTLGARVVAAWPALALLLTVELLSRAGRKRAAQSATQAPETAAETTPAPSPARATSASTGGRPRRRGKSVRRPVAQTRQMIAELRADQPGMTTDALARQLRISERRVRQLLAAD